MSCFQEWTEKLSRTLPIEIPLSKIANAPTDFSTSALEQLLMQGYDRFRFVQNQTEPCPTCSKLAEMIRDCSVASLLGRAKATLGEGVDQSTITDIDILYPRIGVEIIRDAPIYNLAHVGCTCVLELFKSTEPTQTARVTRDGAI